jgi:hypothetical protein
MDFGHTDRNCKDSLSTSTQETHGPDAAFPQDTVSEFARFPASLPKLGNFASAALELKEGMIGRAHIRIRDAHQMNT